MQVQNRFLLLVMVGGAALAVISLSLQFLNLIPTTPTVEERLLQLQPPDGFVRSAVGKSRKRVFPVLHTEEPSPLSEAYGYCNTPNRTEQAWEGHSPADYKLLSVQVMIRHGDRYPLYSIPKTKRPAIDCTLSTSRRPSHPLLKAFISHMGKGGGANWESPLSSVPRVPNHSVCESGELTQTGVVQHLRNGQLLHHAYKQHRLLPSDWSPRQLWVETTGKSRTVQSGLALLYGFLPQFNWTGLVVRHQWNTLFCSSSCDCPARNRYLEEEQRRQYRLRVANTQLERTYVDMARTLGLPTRQLRAANPIDSLLCHLCHNLSFPCAAASDGGGCLTVAQFAVIRQQQLDDEVDRRRVGLYRKYAVLAMYPYLNRTATRMERVAKGRGGEEAFVLSSAHDVTVAPLLSALGLEEARFPRFAARMVFELWRSPPVARRAAKGGKARSREGEAFIRVLYNGEDVTFHTSFCRTHGRPPSQPLCPLTNFLSFVRRDMFRVVGATSYRDACYKLPV
ncbi:2-phosphoxylose phosphatase 1 isoform X1 [Gouania willdenowi]|uniref:2-phosphoxylose phosphatase 1 n=1 Tax=Gouania willdenowi TaxID=441366 RepID=A0A8C5HVJ4_GOUWI|nr:2-phosphoxylose phosphatase 1 isoform X1 [Gouania willdenowi]XP_028321579.1 2-phosphoxylose phosphatase 1 isoform X1 [Gouania willdenowi]XP_028321580.1 2-phosphoxylose phosphatase 1 isoform X1 [Gouania willdenowi]